MAHIPHEPPYNNTRLLKAKLVEMERMKKHIRDTLPSTKEERKVMRQSKRNDHGRS